MWKDLITIYAPLRPDYEIQQKAQAHCDALLKPLGSLGVLEEIAVRLAGIYGTTTPVIGKKSVIVMAADNGVTDEGVASAPKEFTAIQTRHIVKGVTGVAVLAAQNGADLRVVDIGIDGDLQVEGLVHEKIRYGTGNLLREEAMSKDEVCRAIMVGIRQVQILKHQGYTLLGAGEMGIGNTTTSSAIAHALLPGIPVEQLVGKGAGLTQDAYIHKVKVIEDAVRYHGILEEDALTVLQKVGGLDIAGMVGCYIGACHYGLPIVIDGVISMAAAFIAWKLVPETAAYMFASHCSMEPAYRAMAQAMGLKPVLMLNMRLGEGSGCPLMFSVMESACAVLNTMATFADVDTCDDFLVDNRGDLKNV